MKNEFKTDEYKIVEEGNMTYLHITKELNDALLANKELGGLMVELIKQNHVQKIIID